MEISMPTMWNAARHKASRVPHMQNANVMRIVGRDELLHKVMLEAISIGAYVFSDGRSRTVIAKRAPEGFRKVHATMGLPDFEPKAA